MIKRLFVAIVSIFIAAGVSTADPATPLKRAAKYKMPDTVKGRFDHLGVDMRGNRLFLAAETAHEVLVFNLRTGEYLRAIPDIRIPHAVFVREDLNRIFVTDGGAGEVKIFDGRNYKLVGAVRLKVDSDSIGYDPATHGLYIDNGGGDAHESFSMLSIVDTTRNKKVADIPIDGDTLEAMALAKSSPLIYVNNPAKNLIDVVNRETRKLETTWPVTTCQRNVAMALDEAAHRLFTACRSGAIDVLDTESGKEVQSMPIPQGVDDLVLDPASKRLYAACRDDQDGVVAVYHEDDADHYSSLGTIASGPGAKNEVLAPQLHKLFVTIPPSETEPGEVAVFDVQ
jgi:DNA-binding beta-propeller fold protein YncE